METSSTNTEPTPPANQPAPPKLVTVDDLKAYALKMGKWLIFVVAATISIALTGWLANKLGVALPGFTPPAPVIVEKHAAPSPAAMAQHADEVPPPDVLNFCGFKANLIERLTARPWPNRQIKWSLDTSGYVGPLKREQIVEAYDIAFKSWAASLDIDPVHVAEESKADIRARFGVVYDDYGNPDRSGNILAWSELSDGSGRPRRQMYDRAEPWTISSNPGQATIDLVRVAAHELGHAMGLVHDQQGTPTLMAPMYNRSVQFPQKGDIDRAVALGYPRRPAGSGGITPVPTIFIEFSGDPEKIAELLRAHGFKFELKNR